MAQSKKEMLVSLGSEMVTEQSSFKPHWQDLADHTIPTRIRLNNSDTNKGTKKNTRIIDSTATTASRTLASGMMSGVTSPARPWFRLTTPDPELSEFANVKRYLHTTQQRMNAVMVKSNLYNSLPLVYRDMGVFGTSAIIFEEDFQSVFRTYSFPIGSYQIALNDRLEVDVFRREFQLTVKQLVDRYGEYDDRTGRPKWERFSSHVKNLYDKSNYSAWIDITHFIMPNQHFVPGKKHSKYKRFASLTFETGKSSESSLKDDVFLKESGYDFFPVLCPRWQVTGEDVYGTDCPGMTSLGDNRALQILHKRKAQAVELQVKPSMVAPASFKQVATTILPGEVTYGDQREGDSGYRPSFQTNARISEIREDILEHQGRIKKAYFEDLFLMLSTSDRRQFTATEIDVRQEEKLLALGPVLEQLNQDLLDPAIDIIFEMMNRQRMLPEPPEELQGMPLRVEYISVMAQAQKLVGISGLERFTTYSQNVAGIDPGALKKVNTQQLIDVYGDMVGVDPSVIRSDDEVVELEQQEAAAQKQMAEMEAMKQTAATAKDLSAANISEDNALGSLIQMSRAGQMAGGA